MSEQNSLSDEELPELELTKYLFIDCPNCSDPRYKNLSKGGYMNGRYCLVCDANRKLIICYQCNSINRFSHFGKKTCSTCKLTLAACVPHQWSKIAPYEFLCTACGEMMRPEPPPRQKCVNELHLWQGSGYEISCVTCGNQMMMR